MSATLPVVTAYQQSASLSQYRTHSGFSFTFDGSEMATYVVSPDCPIFTVRASAAGVSKQPLDADTAIAVPAIARSSERLLVVDRLS